MKPSLLWNDMQMGTTPTMRAALHIGSEASLLCLRGGQCGEGEIALRLPDAVDVHQLLQEWDGLSVSRSAGDAMPGQQVIRIAPADAGYRALYVHLADDLHDHLLDVTTGTDATRTLLHRLRLWGGFLRRSTVQLDGRAVRGLFAELAALERFLAPALGWEAALTYWTGPLGTPHDITTGNLLLDVKATQVDDTLISVSSIEQLDPVGSRPVLLLQGLVSEGSGESLQAMVARLRASAAVEGVSGLLDARLEQAGADPAVLEGMEERVMSLQGWFLHRADDPGFPRLRRQDLHPGVVGATYRIDLSRSTAAPMDPAELTALLRQTTTGDTP